MNLEGSGTGKVWMVNVWDGQGWKTSKRAPNDKVKALVVEDAPANDHKVRARLGLLLGLRKGLGIRAKDRVRLGLLKSKCIAVEEN